MKKINILAIDGDGVGPEVMDAASMILEKGGFPVVLERPPFGEVAFKQGNYIPFESMKEKISQADAVLFGATGAHCVEMIDYLRWGLDNYINLMKDSVFHKALINTFIYLIIQVPVMIFLSLASCFFLFSNYL